jgi:uncharacterized alpha/beta hydrolase family protein
MKRIFLIILAFFISYTNVAFCQEITQNQPDNTIYHLKVGTKAPITGYLVPNETMAKLMAQIEADKKYYEDKLKLEIEKQIAISQATCDKQLADQHTLFSSSLAIKEAQLIESNKKIDVLD